MSLIIDCHGHYTVLPKAHDAWREAQKALLHARAAQDTLQQERERLQWQITEVDKPKILLDAVVMILNIAGQVLMSLAFMEQWYIWLLVNISSISLWSVAVINCAGSGNAAVMLIKYVFYLLNSINGLRIWLSLSKRRSL